MDSPIPSYFLAPFFLSSKMPIDLLLERTVGLNEPDRGFSMEWDRPSAIKGMSIAAAEQKTHVNVGQLEHLLTTPDGACRDLVGVPGVSGSGQDMLLDRIAFVCMFTCSAVVDDPRERET
jgi:hypothetical protein